MTLRKRIVLLYIGLFVAVMVATLAASFLSYTEYREDVFYERLRARIELTVRLQTEIRSMDAHLMRVIDESTIHSMYDEKVVLFDTNDRIVYSSIDDAEVIYSPEILKRIKSGEEWRSQEGSKETLGLRVVKDGATFIALATARDVTGMSMIDNLLRALAISFVIGLVIVVASSRWFVDLALAPLMRLRKDVETIGPSTLHRRLSVTNDAKDLQGMADAFNTTLERLEHAFEFQQNFVHYASHELNTPIAISQAILQRLNDGSPTPNEYESAVAELLATHERLGELFSSLMLLSGLDSIGHVPDLSELRLDDIVFETVEEFMLVHPTVRVLIEISAEIQSEAHLVVRGVPPLLRTALTNLLENARKYSDPGVIQCSLNTSQRSIVVRVSSSGVPIPEEFRELIFQPFMRSPLDNVSAGKGLGLAIVRLIAQLHDGGISYSHEASRNIFDLEIPLSMKI